MKIKLRFILALLFTAGIVLSQNRPTDLGIEFQAYPTGLIPGLRFEKGLGPKGMASLRLGYQIIDHRDLGKHDSETGTGYGFTLGYKHFFKEGFKGLSLGLRTDLWANKIDWEEAVDLQTFKGQSEVLVLQPTAELGWACLLGESFVLTPTLAFGMEVNIKTKGEKTGEGPILLLGLNLAYRIP